VAAVLAWAGAAGAQEPPPQPEPAEEVKAAEPPPSGGRDVRFSISARGDLAFNTDLNDAMGDVTVTRIGADVGVTIPVVERAQFTIGLGYEHSNYDFHDATGLIAGTDDPFSDVNRETLSVSFYQQQTEQLGWLLGGSIGLSAEDGARMGKSVEGSVFAGIRYAISERMSVGIGANVASQIEDDALVWPLVTFDWQLSEQWRLSNEGRPGLTLSYAPNERWTFLLAGEYQHRNFRLDRDGPLPDGVGRDRRIPVMLGVRFQATPQLMIEGAVGEYFGQNLTIDDRDGNEIADVDLDATPFLGLKLTYRF
jgi:hypothetical protein